MVRISACFFILGLCVTTVSFSLSPPESYNLLPNKGKNLIDASLEEWFQSHIKSIDIVGMNDKAFKSFLKDKDLVTQDLLKLKRFIKNDKKFTKVVLEVLGHYELYNASTKYHPLFPFVVDEILQFSKLEKSKIDRFESDLREFGGTSCAHRDLLVAEIDRNEAGFVSVDQAKEVLGRIKKFRSTRFLRSTLDDYLEVLSEEQKLALKSIILPIVADYEKLKEDHDWLQSTEEKRDAKKRGAVLHFQQAAQDARRKRCHSSKRHLIQAIKIDKKADFFEDAKETSLKVGGCFRRKGSLSRIRFWRSIRKNFAKRYGFTGDSFAYGRIGTIHWGRDDFPEAKKIYKTILKKSRVHKNREVEATALDILGRIAENEGEFGAAIKYFETFAVEFPEHEKHSYVLKSLVLMAFQVGKSKLAKQHVDSLIAAESLKKIDDRDSSILSFALFWGGRLYHSLGQREQAEALWQRGASEYYSTFYGALSHYLLERARGTYYRLQPVRSPVFDFGKLVAQFDKQNQETIRRVTSLLSLGLKDEASCEIEELVFEKGNHYRNLTKSLLQYSSGDWLQAIQRFGKLPRSFRHTLPVGLERLLFPRAYTEFVKKFSKKLHLDSDLIYAIIRQESVFNPKAISPVGARGLMQLMPSTARLEAKRLGRGYVSRSRRREMIRNARHRKRLLDVETNLTLGVHHVRSLMQKFQSPVFVLTSYNASPSATKRWRKKLLGKDMLAFIERIPYKETNAYVKLVMRNYFYYKRWYNVNTARLSHYDRILPKSLREIGPLARRKRTRRKLH